MMGKPGLRTFHNFQVFRGTRRKLLQSCWHNRKVLLYRSKDVNMAKQRHREPKVSKPIKKEDHSGSGLEAVLWYILSQYEAEFNYKEFIRGCEPKRNKTDKTRIFLTERKYNKVTIRNEISTKLENVTEIKQNKNFLMGSE
jgi:hypothetical protein